MRLINSSRYPTDEVRRLARWATRDLDGMQGVTVKVVNARKYCSGQARRGYIEIRLCPESYFPWPGFRRHKNSPLNHDWQDWREALVAIAAHEGRHIHNHANNYNGGRNAGEMNCEAWEHMRLQEFRVHMRLQEFRAIHQGSSVA